ncbi:hypothetical protein L686_05920 [Stutzerimonas stutzeri MF28]|nr:hypothetical protein L686_05920 [Stutzerimonas stutzeri MF28]
MQAMAVSFLSFCGRPDLGAKLLLCAGREFVFGAGRDSHTKRVRTGYGCELLFFVGGPTSGRSSGPFAGRRFVFAAGRGSH